MRQTDIVGAGGDQSPIHPVVAEVALLGHAAVFVECNRIMGAGIQACPAPGTQLGIQNDNSVRSPGDGRFGTGIDTGGIIAVPANVHNKNKIQFISILVRPVFINANQFDAFRRFIFLFAGHLTGLATPA